MDNMVITIDGPAASGKSSLCKKLCSSLKNWDWLSTGVFYRGLAYMVIDQGLIQKGEKEWTACLKTSSWNIQKSLKSTQFIYNGKDLGSSLYTAPIDEVASQVAQLALVREALLPYQRNQKKEGRGLIAEGRDCGTVIFTEAPLKVYLTASESIRAQRRADQRNESTQHVQEQQSTRDKNDKERKIHPLREPKGALVIQNDNMTPTQVVDKVLKEARRLFES